MPTNRQPTSPGEMLLEEFLKPSGLTQVELAAQLGVSLQTVNLIINGKRSVTAGTAIKLSQIWDTSPRFWMNLQADLDLWRAERRVVVPGAPRRKGSTGKRKD